MDEAVQQSLSLNRYVPLLVGDYNAVIERDIYRMEKWLTIKTQDVTSFQYFINEHIDCNTGVNSQVRAKSTVSELT